MIRSLSYLAALFFCLWPLTGVLGAEDTAFPKTALPLLKAYCMDCHGNAHAEAEINLEAMLKDADSFAGEFQAWRKAGQMLQDNLMPPTEASQPASAKRRELIEAIRGQLARAAKQHADDPGEVRLRRLTSAEYNYTIYDLTGVDMKLHSQLPGDAVGGEGFSNVGLVQFVQDSTLEQYLAAAKRIASHALVGAGPLRFSEAPGKTGQELSAIARIQALYREHGFRTAAGEGGEAFGLDSYPKAFFAAWQYKHRKALGLQAATWKTLADAEGLDARFVKHIFEVLSLESPAFPLSEITTRWQKLPAPRSSKDIDKAKVRAECRAIHQVMLDWQGRFGKNPDAKEEAPLLAADTFNASRKQAFEMSINWPEGTQQAHLQVTVQLANRDGESNAVVLWNNPEIQFRMNDGKLTEFRPLRDAVSAETVQLLKFGKHPRGGTIGETGFVTDKAQSPVIAIPIPPGARLGRLMVEAELDVQHGEDGIVRCTIAQAEDTDQGKFVSGILANPKHAGYAAWKAGVLEFARLLPQVSHREPAPSDRDPIPPPFDGSYNHPERNLFHYQIKYHRDDGFLVEHILDDATRTELDIAWIDLLNSFEYHETYLRFIAKKAGQDRKGDTVEDLDAAWLERLPSESREIAKTLQVDFQRSQAAFSNARAGHVEDVLRFAARAWRRPLADAETRQLRAYYAELVTEARLSHPEAIRTLITRVLMAPAFLYRIEKPAEARAVELSPWELASRLSYFLWSSLPDEELNRAAAAGELSDPEQLAHQARRMLRDPKARRLAGEFFGQWFGFYRFDEYRGIDTQRYPEFTEDFKADLHNEAVAFFEYLIREDRPVGEVLFADYGFLNERLAKHYGLDKEVPAGQDFSRVPLADDQTRGGLLGLGAVLTITSAPQRTSPVKRGDWVLRRVLGTPVPPPPADAGSIPADDVLGDGLTVRQRLAAHRRDSTCNTCHSRIDPLGFALEQFDPIGRWREKYRDGKPIDVTGEFRDGTSISGLAGLKRYLADHQDLFHRTLCTKLVGYALGRGESISDQHLIEQMLAGLKENGRFGTLVERIVTSRQFRFQRTADFAEAQTEPQPSQTQGDAAK